MRHPTQVAFASVSVIFAWLMPLCAPHSASAMLIRSGVTTLFADNFENQPLSGPPTTAGAQTGAWKSTDSNYTGDYTVVNDVVPGAAQGTQYVKASRGFGGVLIAD